MSMSNSARLSDEILPICYTIDLQTAPEEKTFFGTVCIDLLIQHPFKQITLHALDLNIGSVLLGGISGKIQEDTSSETITISFPEKIQTQETTLFLEFSGKLNQQMRGLYETKTGGETFAFTQFQATDARRMFPCFDEPKMKARFRLSVTIPLDLDSISNMPIIDEKIIGGLKKITFDETPLMSTYLLALAIARFEKKEIQIGTTTVSILTSPGQLELGHFALKVCEAVLPRLNNYFSLPYPIPKLDLVSVPDFAMGAMENWGAIFFRDSCLLLEESLSSTETQRRVASVITHEIVHQWFGNLVTMVWWDDLWLNESFATWLACKIVDDWRPEWDFWQTFQQEKEIPLTLDALENSRPIHSEVSSPSEIEEIFDVLTYEKGGACLRMLEQFLGEETFRNGIRIYMKRYQYKNATASDLWAVLESVSGQPLANIAKDWFSRPGFPILHIASKNGDLKHLCLSQERFTAGAKYDTAPWPIPLRIKYCDDDGIQVEHRVLKEKGIDVSIPSKGPVQWVYGNADETGFYRTDYEPDLMEILPKVVSEVLSPTEKIGFLGNIWALSRRGDLAFSVFMETISHFKGDLTRVLVSEICNYLELLSGQLVKSTDQSRFAIFVYKLLNPTWERLGWDAAPGEDDEQKLMRANLLWTMGTLAQDEEILSELPRRQMRYLSKPKSIDPTLVTSLLRLCARSDGGKRFEKFIDKFENSKTPEMRDQYLLAMCEFNKPALARAVIDFALSAKVRPQDVWKPIRSLLTNCAVQAESWDYVKTHWVALSKKGGSIGAQRMIQAARSLWSTEWHDDVQTFFDDPENRAGLGERTLAQTLEFIRLGVQFKKLQSDTLSEWLSENVDDNFKKVF